MLVVGCVSSIAGAAFPDELDEAGNDPGAEVPASTVVEEGPPRRLPLPSKGFGGALGGGV